MEDSRVVTLLIGVLLAGAFAPAISYGYARSAHESITEATIRVYENHRGDIFDEVAEREIIRGSNEEDNGTRPLQHFFDPVANRGLSIVATLDASKVWAEDTEGQGNYCDFLLCRKRIGYTDSYFSSPTDFSWDRAVYEYAHGDEHRAVRTLGHILHLIQDATVPAHVRNDQHLNHQGFGDPDPYEDFTANLGLQAVDIEGIKIVSIASLSSAFDAVAAYTNSHFVSKDTLFEKYTTPSLDKLEIRGGFAYNPQLGHRVARVDQRFNRKNDVVLREVEVYLDDRQKSVTSDYWHLLSRAAVEAGVSVINLFFQRVEDERETLALQEMNKSEAERNASNLAASGFALVKGLYGSSLEQGDVEELLGRSADAVTRNDGTQESETTLVFRTTLAGPPPLPASTEEGREDEAAEESIEESTLEVTDGEPQESRDESEEEGESAPRQQEAEEATDETGEPPSIPGESTIGGGHVPDTSAPASPLITTPATSPQIIHSTSTSVAGTAEVSARIVLSYVFEGATTTLETFASGGDWSFSSVPLDIGTTSVQVTAVDDAGNRSESSTAQIVAVDTPLSGVSVDLVSDTCEGENIITTDCLVATTTLAFSWSASGDDSGEIAYFAVDENGTFATTTATTTTVVAADNTTYTFSVSAHDGEGNASATSTATVSIATHPVVINEIAWMGTASSTADEWIELYNNTDKDIDLSDWVIRTEDNRPSITLSGTILAGDYYLLERTDDDTVADISADLIYGNDGTEWALNNGGEALFLERVVDTSTTTIDYVPMSGSSSWFAGINFSSHDRRTMERFRAAGASDESGNWGTSLGEFIQNGTDASGASIKGTPKAKNSISHLIANSATLDEDRTLSASDSPYLVGREGLTVEAGTTLSIGEGVVVKIVSVQESTIEIEGSLVATGTSDNPVVFTAFLDDEYGGDLNADGVCKPNNASSTAACPSSGSWEMLHALSGSKIELEHTFVRYGGGADSALFLDGAGGTLGNVTISHSGANGLTLSDSDATVTNSTFRNNVETSAAGISVSGGAPNISNNTLSENYYGMRVSGANEATITGNMFTNNQAEAVNVSGVPATFSNNSGTGNGENSIVLGGVTTGTSGTVALGGNDIAYRIELELRVTASSTLSFEGGVVVKGEENSRITIEEGGTMEYAGSTDSDIIFTSIFDDTVGGDATVATTSPSAGDWIGVRVESGGAFDMAGFTLRYAGDKPGLNTATGLYIDEAVGTTTISNALFEHNNQNGVRAESVGALLITDSTVRNHTAVGSGGGEAAGLSLNDSTVELDGVSFSGNTIDVRGSGGAVQCTGASCASAVVEPEGLF